jgi:hypothetical protein
MLSLNAYKIFLRSDFMTGLSDQDIIIAAKLRDGKKLTAAEMSRMQAAQARPSRAEWVPCALPQTSDIIRWTEPVCLRDGDSAAILGRRRVTAQVLGRDALKLSLCVMLQDWVGAACAAPPLDPGQRVTRKVSVLSAGDCERLAR